MARIAVYVATIAAFVLVSGVPHLASGKLPRSFSTDVSDNLPTMAPDLIWDRQLPGRRIPQSRIPDAPVNQELSRAVQALSTMWSRRVEGADWTGTPGLVTHLSPPGKPPRAVFWLSDGHLYLVELRDGKWVTRRISDSFADVTSVIDVSGDGQPEIVAAAQHGSGAILALQVFQWDQSRVWTAFNHVGVKEPGLFGFGDADKDGRRELWIDTGVSKALFTDEIWVHGPMLRDRLIFRWEGGTYRQVGRFRFATPFYHLNRCLYLTSVGDVKSAAHHTERGAKIDHSLVTQLGTGPFAGGSDVPFVNGRMYFRKGVRRYYADFGNTGRLTFLGLAEQPAEQ